LSCAEEKIRESESLGRSSFGQDISPQKKKIGGRESRRKTARARGGRVRRGRERRKDQSAAFKILCLPGARTLRRNLDQGLPLPKKIGGSQERGGSQGDPLY